MYAVVAPLLVWVAMLGTGARTTVPELVDQPIEEPTFVLLYTGNTRGYLESCGCGGDTAGGLARRAALIRSLRQLYGQVVLVDSGNVANRADLLEVAYRCMVHMSYDAVGVGILEVGIGADVERIARETGLPLVGSAGSGGGEATPGRLNRQLGKLTIGIVSAGWAPDPDLPEFKNTLRELLSAARADTNFVVLLSQLGMDADRKLLGRDGLGELVDVAITAPPILGVPKPEILSRTLLLPTSTKGRELGLVEVRLEGDKAWYHSEPVTVAKDLPEDPQIAELVNQYYDERSETAGEADPIEDGTIEDTPPLPDVFSLGEQRLIRARGYLTADECGRCHEEQLTQWKSTRHALALRTLIERNRVVQDCLVCHSEANRRGLPFEQEGADLFGVDCAACHGAGLFHASRSGAKESIVRKPAEILCRRCHTQERDANFSMELRLPNVIH